jgi:hypothetical protein
MKSSPVRRSSPPKIGSHLNPERTSPLREFTSQKKVRFENDYQSKTVPNPIRRFNVGQNEDIQVSPLR